LIRVSVCLFFCCALVHIARAQVAITETPEPIDPARAGRLSLEELMSIEIISVAGVEQQVLRTPAAIEVITNEDIRRTGHRHVAEALRLSPGVFVGQPGSHRWAISPRGFNSIFANKTLVLSDGRRLYDPLHGGTFWDVQTPLLEDVDRIEVIRGPGPTLWRSNAVNGVINIVSKSTKDTQGVFIEAGCGTLERGFGSFRYGGQFADNAWFSVWGTHFNRGPFEAPGPEDARDEWEMGRGHSASCSWISTCRGGSL
jgi:iron complex outermembrane recepter protein